MPLLSANIVLCESVLWETPALGGKVPTTVRIMGAITLAPGNFLAHFYAVTFLTSQPGDFVPHRLRIQVTDKTGVLIAQAAEVRFRFGYLLDPSGPGGYTLTTELTLDVTPYQLPLGCLVSAFLDDQTVARTPITLLRG
jgi:hypothetical protein